MRSVITAAAAAGCFLAAGAASAQIKGQQYFGIGGGGGYLSQNQSCPDITCNTGDTCTCITSSGKLNVKGLGGFESKDASYKLEVSADNTTAFNNGGSGNCYGATGLLTLTVNNNGSITVPFAGTGCRIGPPKNAFGVSAPAYISGGTGNFANLQGAGAFSGTFDPSTMTVLFDIPGYAKHTK